MIKVSHLTKRFADCTAVDDVSFEVERGEIVGFLGPNGAGKTTTMRILAGYLPATRGQADIAGFDVFSQSLDVRRRIGYLPENCPLYPEMRVSEYLRFRGQLKGVASRKLRERIDELTHLCGLDEVRTRIIGHLSKGYRQRVGLAESLVHDPELLILDEPTIGLDPNQIRQVRGLIKDLARRHTILLSTHILSEVEMTCRRVLIIDRGRIVASDTPENLRGVLQGGAQVVAELRAPRDEAERQLRAVPGVAGVSAAEADGWVRCVVKSAAGADPRPDLFALAARNGWTLRELRLEKKSLEDIFASLTRADQEEGAP